MIGFIIDYTVITGSIISDHLLYLCDDEVLCVSYAIITITMSLCILFSQ